MRLALSQSCSQHLRRGMWLAEVTQLGRAEPVRQSHPAARLSPTGCLAPSLCLTVDRSGVAGGGLA